MTKSDFNSPALTFNPGNFQSTSLELENGFFTNVVKNQFPLACPGAAILGQDYAEWKAIFGMPDRIMRNGKAG